jgi:hypothetical protein
MKTYGATFLVLLLIGIFAPRDNLINEMGYRGHSMFESEKFSVSIPFRPCTKEHKDFQCRTVNFADLNLENTLWKGRCEALPDRDQSQFETHTMYDMCKFIVEECSGRCSSIVPLEFNKEPLKYLRQRNLPPRSGLSNEEWKEQVFFHRKNPENYPKGDYTDSFLIASSNFDPINNPDHLALEINRRNEIPFFDSWVNVVDNAFYLANEYKLTFLLLMGFAGLGLAGALFIIPIAVTVISGMGAKRDGRYKTGFKDNVTRADAIKSVQGPLSILHSARKAFLVMGTLCYLPFMISIPLLIPGSFASHLVEVIYFYFALLFMGGLAFGLLVPAFIIILLYSVLTGETIF